MFFDIFEIIRKIFHTYDLCVSILARVDVRPLLGPLYNEMKLSLDLFSLVLILMSNQ